MIEYCNMVDKEKTDEHKPAKGKKWPLKKILLGVLAAGVAVVLLGSVYVYAVSPAVIRSPKFQHYHFRLQVLVNGEAENFGEPKYQRGYPKDNCNAELAEQPIHFHDNKDQFVHIHWDGMTGGMVLKYFGWNFIGGMDNALGYKTDDLTNIQKVTIHGDYLPEIPEGAKFYVYTGDENSYQKKSFDDFKKQDLEEFFGKKSNVPEADSVTGGLMERLFPKAYAHGDGPNDEILQTTSEADNARLTRINNLIGNVVIFVQKYEPADAQIKDQFAHLVPLSDSTCGG